MPGAEIDYLEAVSLLSIREDGEAVIAPDPVFRRFLGVPDLRLKLRAIAPLELSTERSLGALARDPPPREHELDLVAQIASGFLQAPDERTRIEARRLPTALCPLGH